MAASFAPIRLDNYVYVIQFDNRNTEFNSFYIKELNDILENIFDSSHNYRFCTAIMNINIFIFSDMNIVLNIEDKDVFEEILGLEELLKQKERETNIVVNIHLMTTGYKRKPKSHVSYEMIFRDYCNQGTGNVIYIAGHGLGQAELDIPLVSGIFSETVQKKLKENNEIQIRDKIYDTSKRSFIPISQDRLNSFKLIKDINIRQDKEYIIIVQTCFGQEFITEEELKELNIPNVKFILPSECGTIAQEEKYSFKIVLHLIHTKIFNLRNLIEEYTAFMTLNYNDELYTGVCGAYTVNKENGKIDYRDLTHMLLNKKQNLRLEDREMARLNDNSSVDLTRFGNSGTGNSSSDSGSGSGSSGTGSSGGGTDNSMKKKYLKYKSKYLQLKYLNKI